MIKDKPSSSKRSPRTHRISFRLSDEDYRIFTVLSARGGFQSLSSFLRYLAYCALRAQGDGMTMDTPEAVLRVFRAAMDIDRETLELASRLVASRHVRSSGRDGAQNISDEVGELFREMGEAGARLSFSGDVNLRK